MSAKLQRIAPIVPVARIAEAAAFFAETLGFEALDAGHAYAIVARDGVRLMLVAAPPDADMTDEARQSSAYVWVDDVDALWSELGERIARLPEGHRRAPFDQDYGMREFHVIFGPLLLLFGAPIAAPTGAPGTAGSDG